jgi:hypothetical protein
VAAASTLASMASQMDGLAGRFSLEGEESDADLSTPADNRMSIGNRSRWAA